MKSSGWFGFANGFYWLLLGLWIGSLVLSGAAAAIVFPLMKSMAPVLPGFAAYEGSHSMLVAGQVMSRVFFVQDVIELIASVGVVFILIMHFTAFRLSMRAPANLVRILTAAVLLLIVSYKAFVMAPRMYSNLGEYWTAAKAGESEQAEAAKAAFDADHPTATNLMIATLGGLIVFIFASAAALSSPVAEGRPNVVKSGSSLEEPELLRKLKS